MVIFFTCCVVEPAPVLYDFKFINNTKHKFALKSHCKKCNGHSEINTIHTNETITKFESSFDCFDLSLKDSLINTFFDTLQIIPVEGNFNINPFDMKNWKEILELKEGLTSKKGCLKGRATYILEIDKGEIK